MELQESAIDARTPMANPQTALSRDVVPTKSFMGAQPGAGGGQMESGLKDHRRRTKMILPTVPSAMIKQALLSSKGSFDQAIAMLC